MTSRFMAGVLLAMLSVTLQAAPAQIVVRGLFEKAALLEIDGRQQFLRAGQRDTSGLLLVSATPREAVIEFDGQRKTLTLSNRIGTIYRESSQASVSLHKDNRKQYRTRVTINGRSADALVDTGATSVAMSASQADQLGISYLDGRPTSVATAGGVRKAFSIVLRRVEIGNIKTQEVAAVVIEGDDPQLILLGMSFLEHVDLQERDNILVLTPRY
ncbi:TIGR02281 family clan AA aspartic protease [Zhongshania arctica]|uniref:TIGR02281 family clan AA aspartic protease n=1 Tax=Zhongshania arctica TaxID=3238302 RepID=A0ABV3TTT9_9GAMM